MATRDLEDQPQTKFVELPTGVALQYAEQGDPSGQPVLFLHGLSDSWHSFEPLFAHLPRSIRALALTQRGHGDSSRPERDYHYADYVADAAAFLDALDIPDAVVVGHSSGSTIAQRFAIDHPRRTTALFLASAFHSLAESDVPRQLWQTVAQMEDPVPREFIEEFQKSTINQHVPQTFYWTVVQESMKLPARVWRDAVSCIMQDAFADELEKIIAPTLFVWGDHDEMVPRSDQDALLSAIANSRLKIYQGTGHAVHWEQPERFTTDLLDFIDEEVKPT